MKDLPKVLELEDPKPINQFHMSLLKQIDESEVRENMWNQPPKQQNQYDWEFQV